MTIKIAACQVKRLCNPKEDMDKTLRFIDVAKEKYNPDIVCFSERYPITPSFGNIEKYTEMIGAEAKKNSVYVLFGAATRTKNGIRNSAILVDKEGAVSGTYDKSHLFGEERTINVCTSKNNIFNISNYKVGIGICYDFLFPEYCRLLTLKDADLLICMAHVPRGLIDIWNFTIKTRSYENRIPIAIVSETDEDFVGFTGFALPPLDFNFSNMNEECIMYSEIEPEKYKKLRFKQSPNIKGSQLFKEKEFGPFLGDIDKSIFNDLYNYYKEKLV